MTRTSLLATVRAITEKALLGKSVPRSDSPPSWAQEKKMYIEFVTTDQKLIEIIWYAAARAAENGGETLVNGEETAGCILGIQPKNDIEVSVAEATLVIQVTEKFPDDCVKTIHVKMDGSRETIIVDFLRYRRQYWDSFTGLPEWEVEILDYVTRRPHLEWHQIPDDLVESLLATPAWMDPEWVRTVECHRARIVQELSRDEPRENWQGWINHLLSEEENDQEVALLSKNLYKWGTNPNVEV